jgi:Mg-chelatase subunit ChlD
VKGTLKRDTYDALAWGYAAQDVPELETSAANLALLGFQGLARDVFSACLRARVEQDPGASPAHETLVRELLGTREYAALRERTRGDEAACSLSTLEAGRVLEGGLKAAGTNPDALRRLAREACRVALEACERADEAARGLYGEAWGRGTHEGQARSTSRRALLEARDLVTRSRRGGNVVQAILREAGRLRRIRDRVRATRSRRGPGCVVGIEQGADPARLLPVELAALAPNAPPALKLDFARRFSERQLLQLKTRAEEPVGRGPIVLCLDQSGSMAGPLEVWSKALCLALLELAALEGRAFALIPFSDQAGTPWVVGAGTKPSPAEILGQLEAFRSGGTDFESPLGTALQVIEANVGQLRHADVVFVTDGLAPISDAFQAAWRTRTQARGTKLHAILLGTSSAACDLDPLADSAVRVPTLADEGDALESAFSVGLN